jgi:hypothetical protein
MPSMMPNDVKPSAKIKSIATTNIDELRNWFRHARGYLRYHNVIPEELRGVYWVSCFLEGPLSKWWYSQVAQTEMKSVEDFPEFLRWRNPKFRNSAEEHRRYKRD